MIFSIPHRNLLATGLTLAPIEARKLFGIHPVNMNIR